MDELMDSNEAAELDANNVYVIEQPTVGQQIVSVAIGTLVPLGVMAAGFGLFAVGSWVAENVADRVSARKAAKAAKKNPIIVESDEE